MKVREIFNSRIPKLLGVGAITLYPFIFYRMADAPETLRAHEFTHIKQIETLGFLRFYFLYTVEYLKGRYSGLPHREAYLNISFEVEARKAELP